MAYRFLLEVPDALYAQANVVISHTPDASIVDVHEGIGGDFDNQGKTLTLSAHSLDVVRRLEEWYADVEATIPGAAVVNYRFTNGVRLPVSTTASGDVVEAIRRDQPWVERSIPKIGDHATKTAPQGTLQPAIASASARASGVVPSDAQRLGNITILATDEPRDHQVIDIDDVPMLRIEVIDLALPERVYGEIFGAALVDRADRDDRGGWIWHDVNSGEVQDVRFNTESDYSFLQNGPLVIALERHGRAYPLSVFANPPAPVRLLVTDESLETIRGEVLSRSWNVMDDSTPGVFGFRDPLGYTWAIHGESFEKDSPAHA